MVRRLPWQGPTGEGARWAAGGDDESGGPDCADIVDRREHGLGYLRNPIDPREDPDGTDWVTAAWAYTLAVDAGQDPPSPAWFAAHR
jgi:hypothetical protein